MLVETVESTPHTSSAFELDEHYFVQAFFENLCSNIRHSAFNWWKASPTSPPRFLKISLRRIFNLTGRTILKDRDSKPLIEELTKIPGLEQVARKSRVETEVVKNSEIIIVEGKPLAFRRDGQLFPVLTNAVALGKMPRITVDMGAVPHVAGGADIMAPGVRGIEGTFSEGQLVTVVDEKHGKFLAVGRALYGSETFSKVKKGKVITSLHYVGDPVWETIKTVASR